MDELITFLKNEKIEYKDVSIDVLKGVSSETELKRALMTRKQLKKLSPEQDIEFCARLTEIFSPRNSQQFNLFDKVISGNVGCVNEEQVNSARVLIQDTLHLESGSVMENLVDTLVTDISETINKGTPFKEMINNLSDTFGKTIKKELNSGNLTINEIQLNAEKLMNGIKDSNFISSPSPQESPKEKLKRRLEKNRMQRRKN